MRPAEPHRRSGGSQANDLSPPCNASWTAVPPPLGITYVTVGPSTGADRYTATAAFTSITGISIAVIAIMLLIAYRSLSAASDHADGRLELLAVRGIISTLPSTTSCAAYSSNNVLVALHDRKASTDYIIFLRRTLSRGTCDWPEPRSRLLIMFVDGTCGPGIWLLLSPAPCTASALPATLLIPPHRHARSVWSR